MTDPEILARAQKMEAEFRRWAQRTEVADMLRDLIAALTKRQQEKEHEPDSADCDRRSVADRAMDRIGGSSVGLAALTGGAQMKPVAWRSSYKFHGTPIFSLHSQREDAVEYLAGKSGGHPYSDLHIDPLYLGSVDLQPEVEALRQERDEEIRATQYTYRAGYEHGKTEGDERLTVVREALERWRNRAWGPQSAIRSGPAELHRCIEDTDAALRVDPSPK